MVASGGEKLSKLGSAIIFGFGPAGVNCLLAYAGTYNVIGFIDNNPKLRSRSWSRRFLKHAPTLTKEEIHGQVFILSSMETFTMLDQLVRLAEGVNFEVEYPSPEVIYSPLGAVLLPFYRGCKDNEV